MTMSNNAEPCYITIGKEGSATLVEKKSEFIGYAAHVENEREALEFIAKIKHRHSDARHNVYAYVLKSNNIMRYSDDGEPQGTAGMPVLDVIRKTGFTDDALLCLASFADVKIEDTVETFILVTLGAGEGGYDTPYHIYDANLVFNTVENVYETSN